MAAWDAVVVGGGPAGLSCALWLARYRRSVCVFDTAEPRNEPAWAVHGFPGILDPTPTELRGRIRQQARAAGASLVLDAVARIEGEKNDFRITTASGESHRARRVVLGYGLRDYIPDIPGVRSLYGTAVFHCADCDGPEAAGRSVAVLGHDRSAASLALYLRYWSERVTLVPHDAALTLEPAQRAQVEAEGVAVRTGRVERLDASDGVLRGVVFEDGDTLRCERLFFHVGSEPRCDLAERLGCELDESGYIRVGKGQESSTPGVYAAGDITGPPHLASTAAADGVRAALTVHRSLLPPSRQL